MIAWAALDEEVAAWRASGLEVTLWWRDDDVVAPTVALDRLLALAGDKKVPLALAVIAGLAEPALWPDLQARLSPGRDVVLVHGYRHVNHAGAEAKKSEFPETRIVHDMLADAAIAREALVARCGDKLLSVFVPPWNRIADGFVPRLANAYFSGLSRYGPRRAAVPARGLIEVNTHVDPIDWRGSRGFVGEEAALAQLVGHLQARRQGTADADEPSGLLSHHAAMDAAGWRFLERLFDATAVMAGVRWLAAGEIFGAAA